MGLRLGLSLSDGRSLNTRTQVMRGKGLGSQALAARLAAQSDVEWAVPDQRRFALAAPNDPRYAAGQTSITPAAGQWYLHAPDDTLISPIHIERAWQVSEGSASVVVAVLDTGIRSDHPDLAGQVLAGYDFIADTATANDGNGRDSSPLDPGDWISVSDQRSSTFQDCDVDNSSWHGTQTSGLVAAATHNAIGMAGVAPQSKLLPVRVLGKCGGYDSDIIAGMRWAAGLSVSGVSDNPNPARVLNLSLGGTGTCSAAYQEAVDEVTAAGALVVAAAGNEGLAVDSPGNCSGVLAVAGLRHAGTKSGFSNLGAAVGLAAPAGNCVNTGDGETCLYPMLSLSNTGTTSPVSASYTDGDNYAVGTSFSAPLVAGTAALMLAVNPALTPAQLTAMLQASARSFPSTGTGGLPSCTEPISALQTQDECLCTTSTCGAGMLDAGAAVWAAAAAANGAVAAFTASADAPVAGDTLTLDASPSQGQAGASISRYQWTLSEGADLASFVGASTGATAQLQIKATGLVKVTLTVTDANGLSASTEHIVARAASSSGSGSDSSSSGGGGAWNPLWGGLLLLAVWALPGRRAALCRAALRHGGQRI